MLLLTAMIILLREEAMIVVYKVARARKILAQTFRYWPREPRESTAKEAHGGAISKNVLDDAMRCEARSLDSFAAAKRLPKHANA
jgi:hypothetical protein